MMPVSSASSSSPSGGLASVRILVVTTDSDFSSEAGGSEESSGLACADRIDALRNIRGQDRRGRGNETHETKHRTHGVLRSSGQQWKSVQGLTWAGRRQGEPSA